MNEHFTNKEKGNVWKEGKERKNPRKKIVENKNVIWKKETI